MQQIDIKTIKDVMKFFQLLYDTYDLAFHPDDPFRDYVDRDNQRTFSDEEAAYLDTVMEDCFRICEEGGVEIYEIGVEVQEAEFKKRGIL